MIVPLSFRIARRYLFAKKKQNFINIISAISVLGVCVGTAALFIVLSVFNGLEALTIGLYTVHNPEIRISATKGKSFEVNEKMLQTIKTIDGVKTLTEVIEDDALLWYGTAQSPVRVKGVSENFGEQYDIASKMLIGTFQLFRHDTIPVALIGAGVQSKLTISLKDQTTPLVFWYPKKQGKISVSNPSNSFIQESILAGGVLGIEQQFDESLVYVPLIFANNLMQYGTRRTSLEVRTDNPASVDDIQKALKKYLGNGFEVKSIREQQSSMLKAIQVERLFVFVAFAFILGVASFNIFFSLAMLAIEKKRDIAILFAMGASKRLVRHVFLAEGALIAFFGASIGLLLGWSVCWIQETFGVIGLGVSSAVVDAYPVRIESLDLLYVASLTVVITLLASIVPAQNALRVDIKTNL